MDFIRTPRLVLRPMTWADLPDLIALHSDPEVMRYITDGKPADPVQVEREVLPRWLTIAEQHEGWAFFAAHLTGTNEFVGWFHLFPKLEEPRTYDLGYRLHKRVWGQGLATEGSRALLTELAWTNRAERVIARCMAGNKASERIMQKLGMSFETDFSEDRYPGESKCARRYSLDWRTIVHRRVWLSREGKNDRVICKMPSGWLVAFDFQTLPGYVLLLSDPVYPDINAAPEEYRQQFLTDMVKAGAATQKVVGAYLMNYMLRGNTDRALHAHICPRYENEPVEKRRTGAWVYYPTHEPKQIMFDRARDQVWMEKIASELK